MQDPLFDLLVRKVLDRLSEHFEIPAFTSLKERDSFVISTLENAAIVPANSLHNLLGVARQVVARWESGDLAEAVRRLSSSIDITTGKATAEEVKPKVFIICKGGLVQEVYGSDGTDHEVCDLDAFEDVTGAAPEEYFDGLSPELQAYLQSTGWNKELPASRRRRIFQLPYQTGSCDRNR